MDPSTSNRTTSLLLNPATQSPPSRPTAMPTGPTPTVGNSVKPPVEVMRPTLSAINSVNHMAPSGPTAIRLGTALGSAMAYSVTTPSSVIRPTFPASRSMNHNAPSGPTVSPSGPLTGVGTGYSVIEPSSVRRARLLPTVSVNQRLPSCPTTMPPS